MRGFTITRVWGIPIRIGTSLLIFLPVLVWLIASGGQIEAYAGLIESLTGAQFDIAALRAGNTPWIIGVLAAVGLFVSVTLHELGHSWVAMRYGIHIESITLWILGGLAALESIPREWNREFWIAIAGPVVSVLVAAVSGGALYAVPEGLPIARFVLGWLAVTNLTLTAFNLLPAFPMDGGRVLRALLARRRPYARATQIAGRVGVGFAVLFAVLAVLSFNVVLALVALFVYGAAKSESRSVMLQDLLDGYTVGDLLSGDAATVTADTQVSTLAERMLQDRQQTFPVVDDRGEVVGVVSIEDLRRAPDADLGTTPVGDVMRQPLRLPPTADAFTTLVEMDSGDAASVLVEADGEVVGVVDRGDYSRFLSLRSDSPPGTPF